MPDITIKLGVELANKDISGVFIPYVDAANKAAHSIRAAFASVKGELKAVSNSDMGFKRSLGEAKQLAALVKQIKKDLPGKSAGGGSSGGGSSTPFSREDAEGLKRTFIRRAAVTHALRETGSMISSGVRSSAGFARDMLRGGGIDLDMGGAMQRKLGVENAARNLAIQGYRPGGPERSALSGGIMGRVSEVGNEMGMKKEDLIGAMQGFVSLTGDLHLASSSLDRFAKTAISSGADLEDVGKLYGSVANVLGTGASADNVDAVVRAYAGQGKMGAVELKDFITSVPKLGAVAHQFRAGASTVQSSGGNQEVGNLVELGALTQIVREKTKGTAQTASQAVASFVQEMTGSKTAKNLAGVGVDTMETDKATGLKHVRDPIEILSDYFRKLGASPDKQSQVFTSQRPRAVAEAFRQIYEGAYSKSLNKGKTNKKEAAEAGDKAIRESYGGQVKASLDAKDRDKDADEFKKSQAARSERIQQSLDKVFTRLSDQVLPKLMSALEDSLPKLMGYADSIAKAIMWIIDNPIKSAFALGVGSLFVSVGKTLAEQLAIGIASKAIGGIAGSGLSASLGTLGGAAAGLVGPFLLLAAAGAAVAGGLMLLDNYLESSGFKKKQQDEADLRGSSFGKDGKLIKDQATTKIEDTLAQYGIAPTDKTRKDVIATKEGQRGYGLGGSADLLPVGPAGLLSAGTLPPPAEAIAPVRDPATVEQTQVLSGKLDTMIGVLENLKSGGVSASGSPTLSYAGRVGEVQ